LYAFRVREDEDGGLVSVIYSARDGLDIGQV
jgi:hypothetical protein